MRELQDEHNSMRTNLAEHRKVSIPVRIVRSGKDEELAKQNEELNEAHTMKAGETDQLKDEISSLVKEVDRRGRR